MGVFGMCADLSGPDNDAKAYSFPCLEWTALFDNNPVEFPKMPPNSSIVRQWNAAHARVPTLARDLAQCAVRIPADATCPIRVEPVGDDGRPRPRLRPHQGRGMARRLVAGEPRRPPSTSFPLTSARAALYPYVGVSAIHGDVDAGRRPGPRLLPHAHPLLGRPPARRLRLGQHRAPVARRANARRGHPRGRRSERRALPWPCPTRRASAASRPPPSTAPGGTSTSRRRRRWAPTLGELVRQMGDLVAQSDNPTYRGGVPEGPARVDAGAAAFRIFRQHCGIEIGVHLATMDTTSRRVRTPS